jgi:Flp pilus assembly pilin Flp
VRGVGVIRKFLKANLSVKFATSFVRDESGQATVEYILILTLAAVGAGTMARSLLGVLDRGILKLGVQLENDLKTGRAPANVWDN